MIAGQGAPATAVSVRDGDRVRLATWGAAFGLLGVLLGAFGAHALRARLTAEMLEVYRTGVLYQLLHAVALLGAAGVSDRLRHPRLLAALWAAGVLIFSGSLYALAITGTRIWGAVTPIGGLALIAGWATILIGLLSRPRS